MQKNKEPSVTSNVPKALYFCGLSDILFFPFVSIKRVLFLLTLENTKFIAGGLSLKVSLVLYLSIGHYEP
jgi:hypothetical protein